MFDVVYFEKEDGSCPISEFLHSLDLKMAVQMSEKDGEGSEK